MMGSKQRMAQVYLHGEQLMNEEEDQEALLSVPVIASITISSQKKIVQDISVNH